MSDDITVFLSYAHEDVALARALKARFESEGFKVWIDEGALRAGDSLIRSIATAIGEMEFAVALITAASLQSNWCQHEIALAMNEGLNREGVMVLPVRVGDVPIPSELKDTFCQPLDPEDLAVGSERLIAAARSHHADRLRASAAGEVLPTSGFSPDPPTHSGSTPRAATRVQHTTDAIIAPASGHPVRIVGIVKEGVARPRNDGTVGSALYRVPLRLSRTPSQVWKNLFVECWNDPPSRSSMHRSGVAVLGDTLVFEETTLDELERVHLRTLKLCVQQANEGEAEELRRDEAARAKENDELAQHQRHIDEVADRLDFDD